MQKEEIYDLVHEILENYEIEQKDVIGTYTKDLQETVQVLHGYRKRLDEIENMIQSHSIGVNNVYEEFNSMKRALNLDPIKELSSKLKKMIKEFES